MLKYIVVLLAAMAMIITGPALAGSSEKCINKIVKVVVLKGTVGLLKSTGKICKGLDNGAEAAFDDPGNDDGAVDADEIVGAADFAKLTAKYNKTITKANAVAAKGGVDCTDHAQFATFPLSLATEADVRGAIADTLELYCR